MIAALYVETGGIYYNRADVDPWDITRDARNYTGPYPVVAHPPCTRWCRLAGLVEARWGHKKGQDGGLFEFALNAVRKWGGVLEHPAYSAAWPAYGLPKPIRAGGWVRSIWDDGWSCHVEQGRYGHPAKKATWLYAFGAVDLPSLKWGFIPDRESKALISWCGNKTRRDEARPRLSTIDASATPPEFSELLIDLAKQARPAHLRNP